MARRGSFEITTLCPVGEVVEDVLVEIWKKNRNHLSEGELVSLSQNEDSEILRKLALEELKIRKMVS